SDCERDHRVRHRFNLRLAHAGTRRLWLAIVSAALRTFGTSRTDQSSILEIQTIGRVAMTLKKITLALLIACSVMASGAASAQTPATPAGAKVYFINLKDGARVKSPFLVQFGLSGMGVAPAGVEKPNTGHHHLLIDTKLTPDQMKTAIPADDTHKHFGGGQTET